MKQNPSFQRLSLLTGEEAIAGLGAAVICVVGLGGVGSWAAEALVRSGAENIILADHDIVDITNINRQAEATTKTLGQKKTDAMAARLNEINPSCAITKVPAFFSHQNNAAELFGITRADYIVDAIDSLESKLDLIEEAVRFKVTLFSSMGMARKLDPARLRVGSIWETRGCPLARRVREGLRNRGFSGDFTVVYSDEKLSLQTKPTPSGPDETKGSHGKIINGSAVTVSASAGMFLAGLVIQDIAGRVNHG